jgi:SAM-dependent methyltransferase
MQAQDKKLVMGCGSDDTNIMDTKIQFGEFIKKMFEGFGFEIRKKDLTPDYESLYPRSVLGKKPFYNVGAGSFQHPYWTNIDYASEWYSKVQKDFINYDLMSKGPLPIEKGSAEVIYTSHTIEHIKEDAVMNFFKEAFKALKRGGVFRITCPNAELDFRAMDRGDNQYYYWNRKGTIQERWLKHNASSCSSEFNSSEIKRIVDKLGFEKSLEYFTNKCEFNPLRPGDHISWWTHDKVIKFLENAGFKNIYRSGYGQSILPILRDTSLFDSTHPKLSLYVEAIK